MSDELDHEWRNMTIPAGLDSQLVHAALRGEMGEVAEFAQGIKLLKAIQLRAEWINELVEGLDAPNSSRVRGVNGTTWNDPFLTNIITMHGHAKDMADSLDSFLRRQPNT